MSIRPYSSLPSYSYDLLPEELLVKCFTYIDLENMPIMECICHTWNRVASDEEIWKRIAFERKTYMKIEAPSIKAKVYLSFPPYCKQARKLFQKQLKTIPPNLKPAQERALIDKAIKTIDLSKARLNEDVAIKIEPLKMIEEQIPLTQVLLNQNIFTADAIFNLTISKITQLQKIGSLFIKAIKNEHLFTPHKSYNKRLITELENCLNAASLFPEYLSPYVKKPSPEPMHLLCTGYAQVSLMKQLEQINCERYENDSWEHTFEKPLNLSIEFPDYIPSLIKKMDSDAFLDFSVLSEASPYETKPINNFKDYVAYSMEENYTQALRSIRMK